MRNLLVLLLLLVGVVSIFSLSAAAKETDEKQAKNLLIERLLKKPPSEEKLAKHLKKSASGKFVQLQTDAQPKLRSCPGGPAYGCYEPDCNRVCTAYGYYGGECVSGGCFCVYYDYYDYY